MITTLQHKLPMVIDWPQVMQDFYRANWSDYRIAKTLRVEVSTVQRWGIVEGDIRHGYGQALLSLHTAVFGQACTLERVTQAKILA